MYIYIHIYIYPICIYIYICFSRINGHRWDEIGCKGLLHFDQDTGGQCALLCVEAKAFNKKTFRWLAKEQPPKKIQKKSPKNLFFGRILFFLSFWRSCKPPFQSRLKWFLISLVDVLSDETIPIQHTSSKAMGG